MSCTCKNGAPCSAEDGSCACTAGFQGSNCENSCPPGRYGKKCTFYCRCSNYSTCNPIDGSCKCSPGWKGNDCSEPCSPGFWGKDCASSCYCQYGGHCSPIDGRCDCLPGWTGKTCSEACPSGLWGKDCSNTCYCQNGGKCNAIDGTCTCPAGWNGKTCSEVCPLGAYGENCINKCRCQNGAECDHVTGKCSCLPGYHGPHCDNRCPPRTYGLKCYQVCDCLHNSTCDHVTGHCQCEAGWSGARCEKAPDVPFTMVPKTSVSADSIGPMIGIIALVILVVALIALFLVYRHWQKDKESRNLAVAYTSTRPASSVYEVPDVPPSYMHYYTNPSYHTLSQCGLNPPPVPSNQDRPGSKKMNPHFANVMNAERERMSAYSPDHNATLPADWKHQAALKGRHGIDRSYSVGVYYNKGNEYVKDSALSISNSSMNSENPYATIKDLPMLMSRTSEGNYMEMKSPVHREMSYAEIGLFDEDAMYQVDSQEQDSFLRGAAAASTSSPRNSLQTNHYDSPKNSHIPSHYDMPPVRQYPPSPGTKRKAR